VTVYVFAIAEEHESVEGCNAPKTMLTGVRVHVSPEGLTDDVRATVPVNPFTGATVMVEVAEPPMVVVAVVGLAVALKSVIV
jgi:hypothetical protein